MKIFITSLFALCLRTICAQALPDYSKVVLEKESDYQAADSIVLQGANYFLSTPYSKNNIHKIKTTLFIMKWMEGTPDYVFNYDKHIVKLNKENEELMNIYIACMVKFSLEHKESAKDDHEVLIQATKMLINYCEQTKNNIPVTKMLKSLMDAHAKGQLEKALK